MNRVRAQGLVFTGVRQAQVATIEVAAPLAGELRLRTLACGVCWREVHVYTGRLQRYFPCVMGHEPVGIVEEVGPRVEEFKVGDLATAIGQASLAEYCVVEAKYSQPVSVADEPAFYLGEPVMCALTAIRQAQPQAGDLVVVNGVGFMGQLLVQALARTTNTILLLVDINPDRLAMAARLGVSLALKADEFTPKRLKQSFGRLADIVFEASGVAGTIWPATQWLC